MFFLSKGKTSRDKKEDCTLIVAAKQRLKQHRRLVEIAEQVVGVDRDELSSRTVAEAFARCSWLGLFGGLVDETLCFDPCSNLTCDLLGSC